MKEKKSIRIEFTAWEKKQLAKAAKLEGRSVKKFIEMSAISATLLTIVKYDK